MAQWTQPTIQHLLRWVYVVALVLCAYGASVQARRSSARTLLALAAPWVILFAVLPQMHERYFVYAAAITAVGLGVSLGWSLLHVLVAWLAVLPMMHTMLSINRSFSPEALRLINGTHPGIGWMVLLLAAIYLYGALAPKRRGAE
jgi:hypothetical protein